MTAITDAIQVITILKGGATTNAELLRIAERFIEYAGSDFQPVDPANPTNEEKARLVLTVLRNEARGILQKQARDKVQRVLQQDREGSIQTEVNTALADF